MRRSRSRRRSSETTAVLTVALLLSGAARPAGQEAAADATAPETSRVVTRLALKTSALFAHAPDDPVLFPDPTTATIYWRGRVDSAIQLGARTSLGVAYEQRLRAYTSPVTGLDSTLAIDRPAFRITPLDWEIASGDHARWQHEIDRLALRAAIGPTQLTIGRQAVGWGRGVMFGAIDLFSPFTPLEADREWRRGIDAARAEIRLSDRSSLDALVAFGPTVDASAAVARVRGYAAGADVEIAGGWRAGDAFLGGATSAPVGGAEIHVEAAVFATPAVAGSVAFAAPRTIAKVVAGASRRLPWGGLLVEGEYHYSGFGAPATADLARYLADPEVQTRYLRGDTQILRRHAIGAAVNDELSPTFVVGARWVHTGADDSGVVMPTITATLSDRWSIEATGYVPYGRVPQGAAIPTQYGATPLALFVQLRFYR
ncbi:MAG TPA: hypothetical protein VLT86_18000 [Vicinamibacterales bacterium]|nr:hypothetical protein [Vicinamibacterales bacterium]